ncbi:hypothetical protein FB451DRAFT_1379115 [Mycena latifolia]|nr:hypothetical protein FB451DRAFT_1379115 [Mycena latifolia]
MTHAHSPFVYLGSSAWPRGVTDGWGPPGDYMGKGEGDWGVKKGTSDEKGNVSTSTWHVRRIPKHAQPQGRGMQVAKDSGMAYWRVVIDSEGTAAGKLRLQVSHGRMGNILTEGRNLIRAETPGDGVGHNVERPPHSDARTGALHLNSGLWVMSLITTVWTGATYCDDRLGLRAKDACNGGKPRSENRVAETNEGENTSQQPLDRDLSMGAFLPIFGVYQLTAIAVLHDELKYPHLEDSDQRLSMSPATATTK